MKYIRTKNGYIYRLANEQFDNEKYLIEKNIVKAQNLNYEECELDFVSKKQVIAQSDTIDKLCDDFVCDEMFVYDKTEMEWLTKQGDIVYGAIWTEKGLIYVAKMNDKGELELL